MKHSPKARAVAASLEDWIRRARDGSDQALGQLLEECRPYLLLVANQELPAALRGKAGASDLVQETFLQAQRSFDHFRDGGEPELIAWLRQILLHNVSNLKRRYCGTEKRQVAREVPIPGPASGEGLLNLAAAQPSPSSLLATAEQDGALRQALDQLPDEYRRVVTWRNYERLSFDEIGRRLDRSAGAARKLWVRAVERLHELLEACDGT